MNRNKKGFANVLYVLATAVMACLYVSTGILLFSDDSSNHNYDGPAMNASKFFNMMFVILFVLLIIILVVAKKSLNHRPYLNVAKIFKFTLIPIYIYGMVILISASVVAFVPILGIMIAASAWMGLSFVGYLLLIMGTIPQIMAIKKAKNEGIIPKLMGTALIIASFFFVADVIALIVLMLWTKKAKNN